MGSKLGFRTIAAASLWLVAGCGAATSGGSEVPLDGAPDASPDVPDGAPDVQPEVLEDSLETADSAAPDTSVADARPDEPVLADSHPRIYLAGDHRRRLADLIASGEPAATRFVAMVDRQVYEGADFYAFSAADAALLYQLTGVAAYGEYAVAEVDAIVFDEQALIAAGERAEVAGDSYLYIGPRVGDLALVYDWCFPLLTDTQRQRWLAYAHQAVWNVWHPEEASWGGAAWPWSGWSIDNPSNNYFYSFLRATMLLGLAAHGEHPDAAGWLVKARDEALGGLLFPTFEAQLGGGGSREGTGYGTAMRELFTLYDLWQGSTGEAIAGLTSHTAASLPYLMHAVVPTLDRLAPIGDHARDSSAALFDYHRHYLLALRHLNAGTPAAEVATTFLERCSVPRMEHAFDFVHDFLYAAPGAAARPLSDLHGAYRAPGVGHVFWRSSWQTDASWVAFIAGPYSESHAHRDQGSFLVYGREWLAYDANVSSHSGIVQDEEVHNLVRLHAAGESIRQRTGAESTITGLTETPELFHVGADLTAVYGGDERVRQHGRELVVIVPDVVVVFDRLDVDAGVGATWHLNTPLAPHIDGDGAVLAGASATLRVRRVTPDAAWSAVAWPTLDADMLGGHRLDLAPASTPSAFLVVLDRDGAALAVTPDDADGMRGVAIALADGREVRLRFDPRAAGGVATFTDAGGVHEQRLGGEVQALPLFDH
jgi:hypothetical protein